MTQVSSYIIPAAPRLALREGFNAILEALRDLNAGPTAPENPVPFMLWMDTSTTPSTPRMRNAANDGWGLLADVMSIYSRTNILGPVGLVSGVPTGAVFETGRAVQLDARWTKFANGTMVCSGSFFDAVAFSASFAGFFRASNSVVAFPQVFTAPPFVIATNETVTSTNAIVAGAIDITAANFTLLAYRGTSIVSAGVAGHYTAIGSWN